MSNEWELPSNVESQSIERLGGGGVAWESGAYDVSVKVAYTYTTERGAEMLSIVLENSDGKELRESFCIKSGNEKGNKTYYTKNGKDIALPGYSISESLCIAATGHGLPKAMETREKKQIKSWDYEKKAQAPVERDVLMSLTNKPVKVAVHQVIEDKQVKNVATGQYEPSGTTKTSNRCKFFGNKDGKTAEEIKANKEATFFAKWAERNTGTVINEASKNSNSAASIMGSTPATGNGSGESIFTA